MTSDTRQDEVSVNRLRNKQKGPNVTELKLYVKPHKDVAMEKQLQSNLDLRGLHQQGSFKQRQHSVTTLNPSVI